MIFKVVGETWRWGGRLILPRAGTLQTQMYQWLMAHPRASLGSKPLVLYTPSCGGWYLGVCPTQPWGYALDGKTKTKGYLCTLSASSSSDSENPEQRS